MLAVDDFVRLGKATAHDGIVAEGLADVLTGGARPIPTEPLPEDELAAGAPDHHAAAAPAQTLARMEHTLATGKPLRN